MAIPDINIDMILSDPMLLVGASLLVFGALLFLISLVKLISAPRSGRKKFVVPHEGEHVPLFKQEPEPSNIPEPHLITPEPPMPEPETVPDEDIVPIELRSSVPEQAAPMDNGAAEKPEEKTVVMHAAETDLQLQLDIIVSQLKNLNQKMSELEDRIESIPDANNTSQDIAALKEAPVNPEDYTKKLLKLAEHVIMLEKEVARMKSGGAKPPVMPI